MADRLDIEAAMATKAGMSYGMWKAITPGKKQNGSKSSMMHA